MQHFHFLSSSDNFSSLDTANFLMSEIQIREMDPAFENADFKESLRQDKAEICLTGDSSIVKIDAVNDALFLFEYDSNHVDFTFRYEQNEEVSDGMITILSNNLDSGLVTQIISWLNSKPYAKKTRGRSEE